MTLHRHSLRVLAADMLGSLGTLTLSAAGWCAHCWRRLTTRPAQPSAPTVPAMPRQRDVTVDDDTLELAQHEALCALLRVHGYMPTPVAAAAEIVALEAAWRSPAAEVEGR
jgi:hypothetical protein